MAIGYTEGVAITMYTSDMSTYPITDTDNQRSGTRRRGCVIGALVVAVLLIVALIVAIPRATVFLNNYFAANGTWYGPLHIDVGPLHGSMETYMALSTSPTGDISGNGQFCLPNLIGGGVTTAGFGVTGKHQSDGSFSLAMAYELSGPLDLRALLGPQLQMHGTITSNSFHLTGGGSHTPTTMTAVRGTTADFTSACHKLSPLSLD